MKSAAHFRQYIVRMNIRGMMGADLRQARLYGQDEKRFRLDVPYKKNHIPFQCITFLLSSTSQEVQFCE